KILSQKTKIHSKKFRDVSGPRVFLGWPARTRRVRTRRRKQSDGHCEHQIRCHLCLGPLKLSRELPHCRRRGRPRPEMTTHVGEAVRDRRNSPFCDMTGRKMELMGGASLNAMDHAMDRLGWGKERLGGISMQSNRHLRWLCQAPFGPRFGEGNSGK